MGSSLMFAEFTPLVLFTVMTVMLIEAAGSVDENTMMPLDGKNNPIFTLLKLRNHIATDKFCSASVL